MNQTFLSALLERYSYLQFVFVKDLDQIYLNELSEALKIKQKELW